MFIYQSNVIEYWWKYARDQRGHDKPHYSDVIQGRWRLKSPASPLSSQPFIQAEIKENIKVPRQWPLDVPGEFPAQMASNSEDISIWWRRHAW